MLSRADTDTAHDAFLALKASREMEAANPGIQIGAIRRRDRASDSQSGPSTDPNQGPIVGRAAKRKRRSEAHEHETGETNGEDPSPQQGSSANSSGQPVHATNNGMDDPLEVSTSSNANNDLNNGGVDILDEYAYLFPDLQAFRTDQGSFNAHGTETGAGPGPGATQPEISPHFMAHAFNINTPFLSGFQNNQAQAYQIPQSTVNLGNYMRPSSFLTEMDPAVSYVPTNPTNQQGASASTAGYMTGFGLTLPPSQPISSFAGGRGESGDDYAARHPPEPPRHNSGSPSGANGTSTPTATQTSRIGQQHHQHSQRGSPLRNSFSGSGSTPMLPSISAPLEAIRKPKSTSIPPVHPPEIVEEMEKQRRLREAVAKLSAGTTKRENEDMTPAEVAERSAVHQELQKALKETNMDERAAEAMQLTMYHISK